MTDHADTIRRDYTRETIKPHLPKQILVDEKGVYWRDFGEFLSLCPHSSPPEGTKTVAVFVPESDRSFLLQEVRCLEAERQQAIDERDAYHEQRDEWAERVGVLQRERDNWHASNYVERQARLTAEGRCEQAIDALRHIARTDGSSVHKARIARNVLLNLGDQP